MSIKTLPERKDIAKEDTWDLESIFPTVDNWENALKEVKDMLPEINKYQGTLGENPQALVKWIKASGEFAKKFMHVYMYAVLDYQVDTTNEDVIKRNGMAGSLSGEVGAAMSFATPEVMEIGFEKLAQWVKDEPDLAPYKHMFERLEILGEHVRSKEIEELLSMLSDPFSTASDTHGVLANADLKFKPAKSSSGEEYELTNSTSDKLLSSTDLDTRKSAWENYADAHLDYKNTMANALATGIKQDWFNARARNYKTSLEAALKPNFIPENVFHNLLDTFKANLPTWHRYWEIRKKALGVDKIHIYDARANLIENMPELSFDKAMDWINEGMAPLGEEYVSIMRKGVMGKSVV